MAFHILPLEISTEIASYLCDRDLLNLTCISGWMFGVVNAPGSPLWRYKFIEHFNLIPNVNNDVLKRTYQQRKLSLNAGGYFAKKVLVKKDHRFLATIRDLVVESYSDGAVTHARGGHVVSRNIGTIERFVIEHGLLHHVLCPTYVQKKTNALLLTLQVVLSHLRFNIQNTQPFGFESSQRLVYERARNEPLFIGPTKSSVNKWWLINALNFFKSHMMDNEGILKDVFKDLDDNEKPRPWRRKLVNGTQPLGRKWKGTYAYLEHRELDEIRELGPDESSIVTDEFNEVQNGGVFQTLNLDFSDKSEEELAWPALFEKHLDSLNHRSTQRLAAAARAPKAGKSKSVKSSTQTRAQTRSGNFPNSSSVDDVVDAKSLSFQFTGGGFDAESFMAQGWLNPLPSQCEIPGWMRWTMMKFYVKTSAGASPTDDDPFGMQGHGIASYNVDYSNIDDAALWAYEGVVLPGGEIVVGRWWAADEADPGSGTGMMPTPPDGGGECYSGPFMFWCVDE